MGSHALDQAARQMGFKNYEHYAAYQAKRQEVLSGNPAGVPGIASPPQPAGDNWLQNLLARIPIHPSYLLGKVNDAFTKAGQ